MRPEQLSRKSWLKYNALFVAEHFLGEKNYNKLFQAKENKLVSTIENEIKTSDSYKKGERLFEIIDLKKGEYDAPFRHPTVPIVFRGAADDWPSSKKWNFDFFAKEFGDETVTLINNRGLVKDTEQAYDEVKFKDFIENLRKGSKDYLKFSRIVELKSDLINDFDYKWLQKFRTKLAANDLFYFFMGGKGTVTPIHNGYAHTAFVQIEGQKKWTFYPASDRLFIGVKPRRYNYFFTDANSNNVDDPNFPLLKYANPMTVTINPGDVLFFPSLIWHQVENVSDSIGVAYKFADFFDGMKVSKAMASLFFFSTKPSFLSTLFPALEDPFKFKKSEIKKKKKEKAYA